MRTWLLAGSLALAVSVGQVHADPAPGAESPAPPIAEAAPADAPSAPVADPVAGLGLKRQKQSEPAKGEEKGKGEEKKEEAPAAPKTSLNHLTATADGYFISNFNEPFDSKNAFRAFDIKDEGGAHFSFGDIAFERDNKPFGGRLELAWGPEARIVNAAEPSHGDLWEHVLQAYVSANLNKDGSRSIDFGKWVTMHGAEVIPARDNWNYSRSLLFTWAIPFYHFGLRAWEHYNATDYVMVNVTRGWNDVTDNNHQPTFGISGSKACGKKFTFTGAWMGGNEPDQVNPEGGFRNLLDWVAAYNASSRWAFIANGDFGTQRRFRFANGTQANTTWEGLAGYARYMFAKKQAITLRAEIFDDPQGMMTGFSQLMNEVTLTYEYKVNKYIIPRLEYRHDGSSARVFPTDVKGNNSHTQDTVGVAMILAY